MHSVAHLFLNLDTALDRLASVGHGSMILVERIRNIREGEMCKLPAQKHRDLARSGHGTMSSLAGHIRHAQIEIRCDHTLDIVERKVFLAFLAELVFQEMAQVIEREMDFLVKG